jgi:hypothetical protein
MEGLAEFAHAVGLEHAFRAGGPSTLAAARPAHPVHARGQGGRAVHDGGCVLEVSESSVLLYQQIDHMSGEPCASFRTWVDHVDVSTGFAFAMVA